MRPNWRTTLGAVTAATLAATVAAPSALGVTATSDSNGSGSRPIVGSAAPSTTASTGSRSVTVTLVTGDVVLVTGVGTDDLTATILPREDGTVPVAEVRRVGPAVYVFPADAAEEIAAGLVDEELFNVTGLITMGYDDASSTTVPVIVRYTGKADVKGKAKPAPATPKGAAKGRTLASIQGISFAADKSRARDFWADATNRRSAAGAPVAKIWLDRKLTASLERSTAQVNAPQAWSNGLTGVGTKVAVLDTGADAEHPDLKGRIIASQDFTGSYGGALDDYHGHGTHTASTVGGSGAASGGAKKGVAPGTQLLIGKVLGDYGGGSESMIIGGMEWAVGQGADVVSMSLGSAGDPGQCDDPIATAAQNLSTTSSSLFVIAAGNTGPANNTVTSPSCAPAALTVGAVDRADETAVFSSRGPVANTHVLKPEIAAPGVGISAARTGGRGADAYVGMSGTSMATPHVAGAAAVLKQAHPTWTGAQLKAALVSSADPAIPGDVRETGAGRLDVAAATAQSVTAPVVQAGTYAWPHTSAQTTTVQVPYTNGSDKTVNLSLSVSGVTGDDGTTLKAAPVTLGTSTLSVPAGATVPLTLKVNPAAKLGAAQYGDLTGRIVAKDAANPAATVSTPFSLYVAPQTVNLTVKLVDRLGRPAAGGSSVDIVNTDSTKAQRRSNAGATEQVFAVRPGHYLVSSFVSTPDAVGARPALDSITYLARPELTLTGDLTLTLDARNAHRLDVKTDRASVAQSSTLSFARTWEDLWIHSSQVTGGPTVNGVYADVQGTAKEGTWEFGVWQRRTAAAVRSMSVGDLTLHPTAPTMTSAGLDGTGTAPVVFAGAGTAADLTAEKVGGRLALVELTSASGNLTPTMVNAAKAAGARGLLLYRPDAGRWAPSSGFNPVAIAAYSLPQAEGEALKVALAAAGGQVTVVWQATARSPFAYNLGFTQSTPVTDAKTFVVRDDKLGRTEASYTSMGVDTAFMDYVGVTRPTGQGIGVAQFTGLPVPGTRTELYTDNGTWVQSVLSSFPFGEQFLSANRHYPAGSVRAETWYDGLIGPTSIRDGEGNEQLTAERQGELMGFAPQLWGDSYGHVAVPGGFGDLGNMVFKRNGEEIGRSAYPFGVVEVPAEDSLYEVTLNQDKIGPTAQVFKRSTSISTTWTFRSHLEPDVFSRALPLTFPRVDLPEDGLKTLAAQADQTLSLRLTGHAGYQPDGISAAKVSTSYDGGTTWTDAVVAQSGGKWTATVDHSGASGKTVALRLELTDGHGNTVTQVVQAAYAIR